MKVNLHIGFALMLLKEQSPMRKTTTTNFMLLPEEKFRSDWRKVSITDVTWTHKESPPWRWRDSPWRGCPKRLQRSPLTYSKTKYRLEFSRMKTLGWCIFLSDLTSCKSKTSSHEWDFHLLSFELSWVLKDKVRARVFIHYQIWRKDFPTTHATLSNQGIF